MSELSALSDETYHDSGHYHAHQNLASKSNDLTSAARKSRFATLGLNRAPALPIRGKRYPMVIRDDRSIHKVGVVHSDDGLAKKPPKQARFEDDAEDLADLEAMMVTGHSGRIQIDQNLPPDTPNPSRRPFKSSKYTTGYLTESGWHPTIDKWQYERDDRIARLPIPSATRGPNANASSPNSASFEGDSTHQQNSSSPLLGQKYFDHDAYLNFVSQQNSSEPSQQSANKRSGMATSSRSVSAITSKLRRLSVHAKQDEEIDSMTAIYKMSAVTGASIAMSNEARDHMEQDDEPPGAHPTEEAKCSTKSKDGNWELLNSNMSPPRVGRVSPKKLKIKLRDVKTLKEKVERFENTELDPIDWNEPNHIQQIAKWRNQIFRRYSFTLEGPISDFVPEETAWLLLAHKKMKATVEAGFAIKIPGGAAISHAFNDFFEGKVLKDKHGVDLPPRQPRQVKSLTSKLTRPNHQPRKTRDIIRKLLEGRTGGVLYIPVITQEDLRRYCEDGTFDTEDPNDESKNAAINPRPSSPKRKRGTEDENGQGRKRR